MNVRGHNHGHDQGHDPSTRPPGNDGWRTPMIEDDHHPLNMWRSQQSSATAFDSSSTPSQEEMLKPQRPQNTHAQTASSSRDLRHRVTNHSAHPDEHLPWKERLKHTSWAWFTMSMATGGLANVLNAVPFRSDWIYVVGLIFFFLNLVIFVVVWAMLLTRFWNYPHTFRASLVHPTESLFVPAVLVSFGTICITIVEYGADRAGHWLTDTVLVLFWTNVVLAFSLSITIYMILWSSLTFTIAQMTPIWIFPAYPLLIIGPHAANLSKKLDAPGKILEVIVGGFTVQGIGFLVSLTIYSAFVYRLMTQKLPADPSRPGMFVSVGPAAFTCSGTIGMAANLHRAIVGTENDSGVVGDFMGVDPVLAAQILRLVGNWMCLWLWGLALWFFFVSVVSNLAPLYTVEVHHHTDGKRHHEQHYRHHRSHRRTFAHYISHRHLRHTKIPFQMTWYSYIFPQTALTTATFRIADAFGIHALKILGCVMTGLLIALWFFVVGMMFRAIILKQILWPEKGEDKEEGGYIRPDHGRGERETVPRHRTGRSHASTEATRAAGSARAAGEEV